MTDDLRSRLAAANPVPPSEPVDPVTSDRARALMEEIMSTPTTVRTNLRRTTRLVGAVAAALAVVVAGAALLLGSGTSEEPLVLAGEGGDAMAICAPFDVSVLATMSPAFAGTVVELTDSVATIEVDRWYAGEEEASTVEIDYTPGFEALIGTPSFEEGQRYLITATDGVVNGCGFSGPATPDLEAAFEEAFGS
ncbi:MAG TPA: hypothetical protein VF377_09480 [Acidimicrobiia bacterium]